MEVPVHRPPVLQGLSCSSLELEFIPDAWRKGVCQALHNFSFGNREMWFNKCVMDSWFRVNVPSCPSSVGAFPDFPRAQSLSPLWCLRGWGGHGVGVEWQGHVCLASRLIKEFDEVHYWLFGRQPIMALTGGRGYLGFGFFFCVWLVVLKWQDLNSLWSHSQCASKHLSGSFTVSALSPCQLFIWVYSNEERNFCQAAQQVRKHSTQFTHSISFTINCPDCYGTCFYHQRSAVSFVQSSFPPEAKSDVKFR